MTQNIEHKSNDAPKYTIGDCNEDGRYPVTCGEDGRYPLTSLAGVMAGHIYRWHRAWYAVPAGQPDSARTKHADRWEAADHLCEILGTAPAAPADTAGTVEPLPVPYLRGLVCKHLFWPHRTDEKWPHSFGPVRAKRRSYRGWWVRPVERASGAKTSPYTGAN
ncbi:hypothetical protein [Streptomyces parvus]|uniref:hypothetical protein n=1 Tax=Streptomyces parvus TaxID=66428 RepID=UPI0037157840